MKIVDYIKSDTATICIEVRGKVRMAVIVVVSLVAIVSVAVTAVAA